MKITYYYSFDILLKKKKKGKRYIYLRKFNNLSRIFNELLWFIYDLHCYNFK